MDPETIKEIGVPTFFCIAFAVAIRAIWKAMLPRIDRWKEQEHSTLEKTHAVMRENSIAGLEISRNNSATLSNVAIGMNTISTVMGKMNDKLDLLAAMPLYALDSDEARLVQNLRVEQMQSHVRLNQLAKASESEATISAEEHGQHKKI